MSEETHKNTPENTIYENAVTSDRTAEELARRHGFESVAGLAESLPENGVVIDVGAGASDLLDKTAELRPDVSFVKFDLSYQNPAVLDEAQAAAPANVTCQAGDATRLEELYGPGVFDRVFTSSLLLHLSLEEDNIEPAYQAARGMVTVAKTGGVISVGDKKARIQNKPLTITKEADTDIEAAADAIVQATRLSRAGRFIQRTLNEVAVPFFGTTRFASMQEGRIPKILLPEEQRFVSPFSRPGLRVMGHLAVAGARHIRQQRKKP
jgi:hypothetical protein